MAVTDFVRAITAVRPPVSAIGRGPDGTIVWVRGEQDSSTAISLSDILDRAVALDRNDLVIDLSAVEFMDASTVAVLGRIEEVLRPQSRSLVLRFPSRSARRVLALCGVGDLSDPFSAGPSSLNNIGAALRTWVPVPASDP
jgi:anti-anti-sigma factor